MYDENELASTESVETAEEMSTKVSGRFNDGNMSRDTNDDVFASEFSVMMTYRRNNGGATNPAFLIPNIAVPKIPSLTKTSNRTIFAMVDGITCEFYSDLNKAFVEVSKDRVTTQRKVLNNGEYIMEDGKVKQYDYRIDPDSFMIITPVNIHRRNYIVDENGVAKTDTKGRKLRYTDPKGFGYIDFEVRDGIKYYKYEVPKSCLRIANMVALVLSARQHPSSYYGYKMAFVNGNYYYLCVINYKREQNDNTTRVLGVANRVDLLPEIKELLMFWQGKGRYKGKKPYMFDTRITALPYTTGNNSNNVGCMFFRGKLAMEAFEPFKEGEFSVDEPEEVAVP